MLLVFNLDLTFIITFILKFLRGLLVIVGRIAYGPCDKSSAFCMVCFHFIGSGSLTHANIITWVLYLDRSRVISIGQLLEKIQFYLVQNSMHS